MDQVRTKTVISVAVRKIVDIKAVATKVVATSNADIKAA